MRRPPELKAGPISEEMARDAVLWMRTIQADIDEVLRTPRDPGDPIPLNFAEHSLRSISRSSDRWGWPRPFEYRYETGQGRSTVTWKIRVEYFDTMDPRPYIVELWFPIGIRRAVWKHVYGPGTWATSDLIEVRRLIA